MSHQWRSWFLASLLWLVLIVLFIQFFSHHDPMGTPRPMP